MKKEELIELIQEIVRAEISLVFASVLRETIQSKTTTFTEPTTSSKLRFKPAPTVPKSKVAPPPAAKKKQPARPLSSNPVLNEILNQTSPFSKDELESLSTGPVNDVGPDANPEVLYDLNDRPIDTSKESMQPVVAALTRDYSALMKAMNKK